MKTVQKMLPHSDVAATLGIYAHSMSEDRLAAQDEMLAAMMMPSNAVNYLNGSVLSILCNRQPNVQSYAVTGCFSGNIARLVGACGRGTYCQLAKSGHSAQ